MNSEINIDTMLKVGSDFLQEYKQLLQKYVPTRPENAQERLLLDMLLEVPSIITADHWGPADPKLTAVGIVKRLVRSKVHAGQIPLNALSWEDLGLDTPANATAFVSVLAGAVKHEITLWLKAGMP